MKINQLPTRIALAERWCCRGLEAIRKFVLRISHEWSWLNWTWNEDSAKEAEEWVEGMLRKIIAGSRWLWDLIYQISIAYSSDKMDSTAPAPPLVLTHSQTFSATFAFEFIGFNYGPMVVTSHQLPEDGERLDMESGLGEEPSTLYFTDLHKFSYRTST